MMLVSWLETLCFTVRNTLFQVMKHFVSYLETVSFKPLKQEFQGMETKVSRHETETFPCSTCNFK